MATLSSQDISVRLQLSAQAYSGILSDYMDALRFGKKNANIYESKLYLIGIYISLLQNYTPCECGLDCTNNCITEEQAQSVSDKLAKLTGVCFQPIGFNYIGSTPQGGIGKMQIGCNFIVS